jgi:sRNA-binding carbon storage regulator CsrA
MGLLLTLDRDDAFVLSGGTVVVIDDIGGGTADITVVSHEESGPQFKELNSAKLFSRFQISPEANAVVREITEHNIQLEVNAPKSVKIFRFQAHKSQLEIKSTLARFGPEDNIYGIEASILAMLN